MDLWFSRTSAFKCFQVGQVLLSGQSTSLGCLCPTARAVGWLRATQSEIKRGEVEG